MRAGRAALDARGEVALDVLLGRVRELLDAFAEPPALLDLDLRALADAAGEVGLEVLVGAVGMSYEEAAEVAQCAVGTIKSRVNRARTKLTEVLGVTESDIFGQDAATAAIVKGER